MMYATRTAPRALGALTIAAAALAASSTQAHAQELTEQRRIAVARRLQQSTVSVAAGPSSGSGFVTGDEGWVVTNSHVIRPGRRRGIQVRFSSGTTRRAEVLLDSPSQDLAVLRIEGEVPVHPLALADSDQVSVGQTVLAFGSPFGLDGTLTQGIVSALRDGSRLGGGAPRRLIQTDAPINPGNSGGPLVSSAGEVIGVNTAILSRTGGSHGIGFAVPSNDVRELLDEVRRRQAGVARAGDAPERAGEPAQQPRPRRRAQLQRRAPRGEHAQRRGHDQPSGRAFLGILGGDFRGRGVRIERVVPDSPAAAAGLAGAEDPAPPAIRQLGVPWTGHVIVAVDGHRTRSMDDLQHVLSHRRPGQRAVLTVLVPGILRGQAMVTLGEPPPEPEDDGPEE